MELEPESQATEQLLMHLESFDFSSLVYVCAGVDMARRVIEGEPIEGEPHVRALAKRAEEDSQAATAVLNRLRELALAATDPQYETPYDAALAALLVVVEGARPNAAMLAANLVARVPNAWWARKLAAIVLGERRCIPSDAHKQEYVVDHAGAEWLPAVFVMRTGQEYRPDTRALADIAMYFPTFEIEVPDFCVTKIGFIEDEPANASWDSLADYWHPTLGVPRSQMPHCNGTTGEIEG